MIQCPRCQNSLPDWVKTCQFCQADTSQVSRPPQTSGQSQMRGALVQTPNWVWPTYYVLCCYFMLSGVAQALEGAFAHHPKTAFGGGGPDVFAIITGVFYFFFGLGLACKVEFVRGFANVLCFLGIAFGLLGLAGLLLTAGVLGNLIGPGLMFLMLGQSILNLASNGLMIYLLGETD